MPIIINEVVFRGEIAPNDGARRPPADGRPPVNREALIQACVAEVLRILERQKER